MTEQKRPMPQKKRGEAEREHRRAIVASNLLAGMSYREIASRLNVSVGTVKNDADLMLKRWRVDQTHDIGDWSTLQVKRLDLAINSIWGRVLAGDLAHIERLQRLIEQQARLLGFDSSIRIDAEKLSIVLDR